MRLSQQKASDPNSSCWVNASAGSGKTKVLIDKIIRLLLHSANPERILCLTFSRAAANEMQQRLLRKVEFLGKTTEAKVIEELIGLGETSDKEKIIRASNLHLTIQSHPISIQTVHGFCQSLLQRNMGKSVLFSSPRIMENFEESTYLAQAFEALVENPEATSYLEEFLTFYSDNTLFEYLSKTTRNFQNLSFDDVLKRLHELFDIKNVPEFPVAPVEIHQFLKGLLNVIPPPDSVSKDHSFVQCFLTQKGTVRAKILPASLQKQYPDAEIQLRVYAETLAHYFTKKTRFDHVQKSLHFWHLQQAFNKHYKIIKETLNLWDFHDLIAKTLEILSIDTFDQILLDLNYRIDHILVDEAQDTSIDQWRVITHLVNGLFNEQVDRSLFVVGDEKQSIYSFQGADICTYKNMQKDFSSLCNPFEHIHLTTSFRSSKDILKLVDAVFEKNANGLGNNVLNHTAYHSFLGNIEILPFFEKETENIEPWPIFESYFEISAPEELLAENALNYIEKIIHNGLFLASENRCATYNDVMILMRKRGTQMRALTDICEKRKIPYSAFEPKSLLEFLVVRDILSAVEFMLMPQNDLNLAALLKSPWMRSFGIINEEDLFNLCYNRKNSLWHEIQFHYSAHAKALNDLRQSTPTNAYDYFQCAYNVMNIECELLNNFMDEVFKRFNLLHLGIRELIEHLHSYPPIFTQTSHQEGIKLSTVHGAKGLEAPIVAIFDNGEEPNMKQDIVLYDPVKQFWFLKPPIASDTILTSALKEHHQQALEFEHNRLFYVALTRAKEHLILAGLPHEPSPHSWYWRVCEAIKLQK